MNSFLRWGGVALFTLLSLFLMWFGALYASVTEPLWFHAAAVPADARDAVRPLYFALMSLIGGSSFALGALGLFTTATAVRRGSLMAAVVVSLAFSIAFAMAAVTAERLAAATGAPTSWRIMGALLAVTAIALACSASAKMARPRGD